MLKVRRLTKSIGAPSVRRILFDALDFDVAAGEILAITGESGSGKSTLLNVVAGLDAPDGGTVEIDGIQFATLDDGQRSHFRRHRLGFVFQAFHLLPHLTIADNVALPLVITGHSRNEREARLGSGLRDVGLEQQARSMPRELSGGEMQRAAIARALIHRPQLILADEPTGNLDPENATRVLRILREQVERSNAACLLVTHSTSAAEIAHRRLVLSDRSARQS